MNLHNVYKTLKKEFDKKRKIVESALLTLKKDYCLLRLVPFYHSLGRIGFLAYVYRPKVTFDDYGGLIDYLIESNFCVIPSRSFQQFNSFAGKLNEVLKDSTCFIYRTTYTRENDDSTHTSILIFRFEFYLNDPNVDGDNWNNQFPTVNLYAQVIGNKVLTSLTHLGKGYSTQIENNEDSDLIQIPAQPIIQYDIFFQEDSPSLHIYIACNPVIYHKQYFMFRLEEFLTKAVDGNISLQKDRTGETDSYFIEYIPTHHSKEQVLSIMFHHSYKRVNLDSYLLTEHLKQLNFYNLSQVDKEKIVEDIIQDIKLSRFYINYSNQCISHGDKSIKKFRIGSLYNLWLCTGMDLVRDCSFLGMWSRDQLQDLNVTENFWTEDCGICGSLTEFRYKGTPICSKKCLDQYTSKNMNIVVFDES